MSVRKGIDSWDGVPVWLLADCAIDRLTEEVGVAGVAGRLLDQVQKHPAE